VNVAADKNFEADVRDKVFLIILSVGGLLTLSRGIIVHSCGWQSHHPDAAAKFVRVSFSYHDEAHAFNQIAIAAIQDDSINAVILVLSIIDTKVVV
jgi:hypothetical protein